MTEALTSLRRAAEKGHPWSVLSNEVASALVAEVERLRGVNADLRLMVDGLETAAHEERAAVVAWLRRKATDDFCALRVKEACDAEKSADDIERGEHRREEER